MQLLQKALNPHASNPRAHKAVGPVHSYFQKDKVGLLIGDKAVAFKIECDVVKVMKLVNDVKMGLCNGDTGYVSEVERPVRLLVHVVASTKNNLSRLGLQ